jgi:hypothetical protein
MLRRHQPSLKNRNGLLAQHQFRIEATGKPAMDDVNPSTVTAKESYLPGNIRGAYSRIDLTTKPLAHDIPLNNDVPGMIL